MYEEGLTLVSPQIRSSQPIRLSCYNDRGENDLNVYADGFKMPDLVQGHPNFGLTP